MREAEDDLRLLVVDPARPDYWSVRLQVSDLVPPVGTPADVDAAVRAALQQRTDLRRTRKQLQIDDTNLALARNEILPDVRVNAAYLTNGLGGTQLAYLGGFPGTPTPIGGRAYGDVLRQIFAADYPTWTVGLCVQLSPRTQHRAGGARANPAPARTEHGAASQLRAQGRT